MMRKKGKSFSKKSVYLIRFINKDLPFGFYAVYTLHTHFPLFSRGFGSFLLFSSVLQSNKQFRNYPSDAIMLAKTGCLKKTQTLNILNYSLYFQAQ
jgi:hypothetical protein